MKLSTGNTPRQELISQAQAKMKARGMTAHQALESVIDGCRPGTIGGAMREYYINTSDYALERLIAAVEKG